MSAGIKSVRVHVEPDEQMSGLMVAAVLRELASRIDDQQLIYARDLTITWTPDGDSFECDQ